MPMQDTCPCGKQHDDPPPKPTGLYNILHLVIAILGILALIALELGVLVVHTLWW